LKRICVGIIVSAVACAAITAAAPSATSTAAAAGAATDPVIKIEDVDNFYKVYDAAGGHPTAVRLQHDYIDAGSDGLQQFAKLRNVSGTTLAGALVKHPEIYADARRCLSVLPSVKQRLTAAFRKLGALYPEAKFPPVTLLIGRGRPVGITDGSGVSMGLEALCAANFMDPNLEDRFVHTIAHEYGHIQQPRDLQLLEPGDPGATVLRMSLMEGAAEFTAELISGDVGNYQHKYWTKGREAAIESAFVRDEDQTDLSRWLNNGPGDAERPGDLGYWVGYRIVKAYYQHASDKHRAFSEILEMTDPKGFLAKSAWYPGIRLL
jgi:hypothetical protein